MAHFAKVENGIVTQVIVIEREVLDLGHWGDPASWVQTSYNTQGGVHTQGGTPLRKNYAGAGFIYDVERDAFIPPKKYVGWFLDEATCLWTPPTPMPTDGKMYTWDEATTGWIEVVAPIVTPEATSQESVADGEETPVVTPEATSPAQE